MSNFDYSKLPDEVKLREIQAKCHHHSFRCSECHLYQDNVLSDEALKIKALEKLLTQRDELLIKLGVLIIPYNDPCQECIIKEIVEKEKQTLIEKLYRHSE